MKIKPLRPYLFITDFTSDDDKPLPCPEPMQIPGHVVIEDAFNDFYIDGDILKSKTVESRKNNLVLRMLRKR